MKRRPTGRYEVTSIGSETVRAFVPDALPPKPPLEMTSARRKSLEQATVAVGGRFSPYPAIVSIGPNSVRPVVQTGRAAHGARGQRETT